MATEKFKALCSAHIELITERVTEIEEIIEGRIDIDDNGNANPYMKIKMELAVLCFILGGLKEHIEKDQTT